MLLLVQNLLSKGFSTPLSGTYTGAVVLGVFITCLDIYWVVKCLQKLHRDSEKRAKQKKSS